MNLPLWLIYSLFSAVFASLVAIFGKMGISKIDPTLATTVRSIIMATTLITISLFSNKFSGLNSISNKGWIFIFLAGFAGAASWFFYFLALKSGNATNVAAVDRLSVVFVFIFALIFLGEQFNVKTLVGILLITLGAIVITFK